MPIFLFPDDNSSKQWISTKLGMCIDIVEIWFGIANGQILPNFDAVICPRHTHIFVSVLFLAQAIYWMCPGYEVDMKVLDDRQWYQVCKSNP